MVKELRALTPVDHVLELACETGIWHRNSCVSASFYPTSPFRLGSVSGNFAATRRICKIGTLGKGLRLSLHNKRWNARWISQRDYTLQKVISETGLPNIRFHDLRHTVATLLLAKEINPKIVQELLGHASINLTLNTYSHVIKSMRGIAVNALEEVVGSD